MCVGLVASLLQSVTSLQEPTLTFAPKLIALAGLALLLTPWLLRSLSEFTISVINRMPGLAH
jgi:flagellar biosynthetic protein FliQ